MRLAPRSLLVPAVLALVAVAAAPARTLAAPSHRVQPVVAQEEEEEEGPDAIEGQYIVTLRRGFDPTPVLDALGVTPLFVYSQVFSGFTAKLSNVGSCVDILAPGTGIVSARLGGGSTALSGTSMASPRVTGVAALYKQANGDAAEATMSSGSRARRAWGRSATCPPRPPTPCSTKRACSLAHTDERGRRTGRRARTQDSRSRAHNGQARRVRREDQLKAGTPMRGRMSARRETRWPSWEGWWPRRSMRIEAMPTASAAAASMRGWSPT